MEEIDTLSILFNQEVEEAFEKQERDKKDFLKAGGISEVAARSVPKLDSANFRAACIKLAPTLKMLGIPSLREGQDRAVMSLLMRRDTIALLPTGHGKSLIYMVPTICHDWKCLIFSPLISLMQDQWESLCELNLAAAQISSGVTVGEQQMALRQWEAGDLQFLLVAPERMDNADFQRVMRLRKPNLIVTDEAHCISTWSQTFRKAYGEIGKFIHEMNPDAALALTATATVEVERDIRNSLGIKEANRIVYYPKRANLELSSRPYRDIFTVQNLINASEGSTIIYCGTRKNCEELYNTFGKEVEGGSLVYHGGMTTNERTTCQDEFMSNKVRVMFATNAFGMGVDKKDIRNVIHRDMPQSVEAYAQESGRAGRDGKPSKCILLFEERSLSTSKWMIEQEFPPRGVVERVYHYLVKTADPKTRILKLTTDQIADAIREDGRPVGSALAILDHAGVVVRGKDEEEKTAVKLVKTGHIVEEFDRIMQSIRKIGFETPRGHEFGMPLLIKETGFKATKLNAALKALDEAGYVAYAKPFKGKTTQIVGGIEKVDFQLLSNLHRDKLKKLGEMLDYYQTPDNKKHQFLLDYFVPSDKKQ